MRLLLTCFLLISSNTFSQFLKEYNQERLKIDKTAMTTLSCWSAVNIGVSSVGWATTTGEARYFHQMNTIWSGINLLLSVPGLIKAHRTDPSSFTFGQTWREQIKSEKIFAINTALDVGYVTTGLLMRGMADPENENYQQLRGFGSGIILQGGFLLLFDLTATIIHTRHKKNKLNGFLDQIEMSDTGLGIKVKL